MKITERKAVQEPQRTDLVADGRRWRKIVGPKPWQPKFDGDVLVGKLLARATRPGNGGGVYGVATIQGPDGPVTISGTVITGLFDAAGEIPTGLLVRVTFLGWQVSRGTGREYRSFELHVEQASYEDQNRIPRDD